MDNSFGQRLKKLRIQEDLTQEALSLNLHLSRSTIAYYESGLRSPDLTKLCALADYFNVSVDYLLGRTNIKKYISDSKNISCFIEIFYSLDKNLRSDILNRLLELESYNEHQDLAAEL